MYATATTTFFILQNPFLNFRICSKNLPSHKPDKPKSPLRIPITSARARLLKCSITKKDTNPVSHNDQNPLKPIVKPIVCTLFSIAFGLCPLLGFQFPAIAVPPPAAAEVRHKTKEGSNKGKDIDETRHEYSHCTKRLLETVSKLLKVIEEVKSGKEDVKCVEEKLKDVNMKRNELQKEIMNGLYVELRLLNGQRSALVKRSEELLDVVLKIKRDEESLLKKAKGNEKDAVVKEKVAKLDEEVRRSDEEYNEVWERIAEIDDGILSRETLALSIGVRELASIVRECQILVKEFLRKMRLQSIESMPKSSLTKLSRSEIKEELQTAHKHLLQQIALPDALEDEDNILLFDQDLMVFGQRIEQVLKDSREMQRNLESRIKKKMKRYGDGKRFVVNTPVDEVVKGFPEIELKWMFGNKEVVVPKAVSLHLHHGWKKWREDVKADLKRDLLENVEQGKKYMAEKQERILLDRDRVVAKSWYNEERNRWEMDPVAVPYAMSKKLLENARIRHDWAVMYVMLKGDDKEYYVDIKEYEMIYEDFGGFDALYLRMVASGIPTVVQLMWIPFSVLDFRQQFLLVTRLCHQCLNGLWSLRIVSRGRDWILEKVRNINDDIMMMIVFPTVEFVIPYRVRIRLGMAWPEYFDQSVASTWYLKWQSEAEVSFRSRKKDEFQWYLWFLIRAAVYIYVLYHVIHFMKQKVPRLLGYGPLRRNPNIRKLQRVKAYFRFRTRRIKQKKKAGVDPISTAFDQMKRVKNPPIRLKDFASIESMREEINEVVAFLQNPRAFQEMGARAPRAPVIIFVEDFDLFAGVRGKFIHTKKQDHEAFINQLLVELDGFEKQDGVVLMATTRNLKQIDEALQRPGRMDRIFRLQRPTQAEREKILRIAAKGTMDEELIDFVDWRKVAEKTALLRLSELKLVPVALEGSAFRSKFLDIDELMTYCSWFATFSSLVPNWLRKTKAVKQFSRMLVNHLGLTLTKEDLENVVDLMEPYGQISSGIELLNPPLDWTMETKFPHAVWAAGRSLIALLLPSFDIVDNLWLEPFSWEGIGCTKITKAKNEGSISGNVESRSYLEKRLVFCFGSYIAAQLLLPFGEENILSSSELKQAEEIATRMVIQYGWGPDDSPTIYHHGNSVATLSMGNHFEYEMAAKVEKMYYMAYDKAKGMLQKNRQVLEKIVEELLKYEVLTRKDLERIIADNDGVCEKEPFFLSKAYKELLSAQPVLENFLQENGKASSMEFLTAAN
ncbi:probable inactive ATP-dependent zinc metalloprotease FTSHI 5, chloroplastic isoform X3 [Capsicum annuum]|uniref:probable inactive ATP-dependent zinc metalloprotease FTSHI 5, chloroplastic isoform X3 n=1 Tax=Capsicum annuum TaxID=4072 RepID=UPI0007BEE141|nr:probable inactive ATP-dependent zinc metalloprotease FTSHI 5, chloroplastic isoform X3 [Capsicum annuum]